MFGWDTFTWCSFFPRGQMLAISKRGKGKRKRKKREKKSFWAKFVRLSFFPFFFSPPLMMLHKREEGGKEKGLTKGSFPFPVRNCLSERKAHPASLILLTHSRPSVHCEFGLQRDRQTEARKTMNVVEYKYMYEYSVRTNCASLIYSTMYEYSTHARTCT